MSNPYRKEEAPVESPTFEQRIELVSAAIQKLYLAKGGDDIEAQIKVARADVDNALICREAEAARLKENPNALREKGERPFVTVSEDRLHSRELSRLHDLRDTRRGQCRTQIQEALNCHEPRSLEEWRKVLDLAAKDIDDVANMLPRKSNEAEAMAEFEAVLASAVRLAQSGKLEPEQREALLDGARRGDGKAVVTVLGKLPPALQDSFEADLKATFARA